MMIKTWMLTWLALTVVYVFVLMLRYEMERLKARLEIIQYQQIGE